MDTWLVSKRIAVSYIVQPLSSSRSLRYKSHFLLPSTWNFFLYFEEFPTLKVGVRVTAYFSLWNLKSLDTCFFKPPCSQRSGTWPGFCLSEAEVSDAKKLGQSQIPSGVKEPHLECRASNNSKNSSIHPAHHSHSAGNRNSGVTLGSVLFRTVIALWDSSVGERGYGPGCLDAKPDFPRIQ